VPRSQKSRRLLLVKPAELLLFSTGADKDPIETYSTNVMGTAHLLEALRQLRLPCGRYYE
jgi:nucleoside-diphosphate-sugar epimerase